MAFVTYYLLRGQSTLRWVMLQPAAKFVVSVSVRVRVGVRVEELRTGVPSIEVRYAIGFG